MTKENYQKAVLIITAFDNDGIHTDVLTGSGPVGREDMTPVIGLGTPISGLADLQGQRDTFGS